MSAPQDLLKQAATAEGQFANAVTAPFGIASDQRPPTPLELLSKGLSGQALSMPKFPPLPGMAKATPPAASGVGAQATEKAQTTATWF